MSYDHGQYQYAALSPPEQQHSLPYIDSTYTQQQDGRPSSLVAAQERASQKRVARNTCLIAIGILLALFGLIFALLLFICVFHQCQASRLSIVSTAPLGRVLTISQVASHVAPVSVPIIMGLFAYFLSAKWVVSSVNGGPNRPSPMQLGLLMLMCNGAGLSSILLSAKYVIKRPKSGQKVSQPPILRQSIIFLGSLLLVTYITAGADSWLHASSTSVIVQSNTPYNSLIVPNFGREINGTMCQLASTGGPITSASCGQLNDAASYTNAAIGEGIRTADNASTIHRVVLTDDQTAIVVPESLPPNITYVAQTVGLKSQCVSITKQCLDPTIVGGQPDYGPDAVLDLNCAKAGIKYLNGTMQSGLCALDSQGICTLGFEIPSNPFTTGEVATSLAYLNSGYNYSTFVANTGWFLHGESDAWNVIFCNITAVDVTYGYQSSRYIMQSASPKSLADTRAMMSPGFLLSNTAVISEAVDGAGLQSNTTYEEAYSLELSRFMLARGAGLYAPTDVLRIESNNYVNGSKLQVIPLAIFVATLLVLACQVLYIALRIIIATWGIQYVQLAALHLSDPLTMMQMLYGHPDPVLTWETDSNKRFGAEMEEERLSIGPVPLSSNGSSGSVFMVTKG
ncbi:hypothetical protein CVT26_002372 [Gymnopilus dilepis]|uniref:Uncharacterized protein n=1 Tax=Gymnopilus dilepis TaxID=231916 RepID=A0A409Y3J2_9AGAR|nr:hypothetical protein CVT26_002372 [Gymnopilus dilepis]